MLDAEYRHYLHRAAEAVTVRELRAIATEAREEHPDDPAAELVDQTCFFFATGVIERQWRTHPAAQAYAPAVPASHVPALRPARADGARHLSL